jgi:hypothetical protein
LSSFYDDKVDPVPDELTGQRKARRPCANDDYVRV